MGKAARSASYVCWLGLLSLVGRHPCISNAGDLILTQLLLWGSAPNDGVRLVGRDAWVCELFDTQLSGRELPQSLAAGAGFGAESEERAQ